MVCGMVYNKETHQIGLRLRNILVFNFSFNFSIKCKRLAAQLSDINLLGQQMEGKGFCRACVWQNWR